MHSLQIRRRDMCVWKAQEVREDSLPIRVSFASESTDFSCCNSSLLTIYSYVQMLERQHAQLIAGLQELYRRIQNGDGWPGPRLEAGNHSQPLIHKILEALGVLQPDEWEEMESLEATWQDFEKQGQDNTGWIYSETTSPSTQAAFPVTPPSLTAFPQSAIMSKRRSKLQSNMAPITQTLSMPPPLMTTLASIKPEPYDHAPPYAMTTTPTTFPSNEQMNMGLDRVPGSTIDWPYGMDDLFGNLASQEQTVKGC